MIVGLTGPICAGKRLAADYLIQKGFAYYSLSDVIREEAKTRNIEKTKKELQKLGTALRTEHGANYLALIILKRISLSKGKNFVVDSFRCVDEVKEFKKRKDFVLVAVDAALEIRIKRILQRGDAYDPKNLAGFLESNAIDFGQTNEADQNVKQCMDLADFLIKNEGAKEEFVKKMDAVFENLAGI